MADPIIAFDEYTGIDAVNWSTLKEMRRSPLHYKYNMDLPRKETATLRAGRASHTAVFEPDRFMLDYAVYKGKTRRGKKWEAFKAAHHGQTILRVPDYEKALAFRDAVRSHDRAKPYLESGAAEITIRWRDNETGLLCKARLDFRSDSKRCLVDLKGTGSIVYGTFANTAYKLGYHCQLGFYKWGLREALGLDWPVTIIAVESAGPHDLVVFDYSEECLATGLDETRSLLTKLAYHREKNEWPGMYSEPQYLEFPAWVDASENDDVSDLGLEA